MVYSHNRMRSRVKELEKEKQGRENDAPCSIRGKRGSEESDRKSQ